MHDETQASVNDADKQAQITQIDQDTLQLEQIKHEAQMREVEAERRYAKAAAEFDKGDIDEALMYLRSALSLMPQNPKYHYNIGFLYWKKDLLEVALNHYKLFIRYVPANDKDIEVIKSRIIYFENQLKKRKKPHRR
ncbi:MAG: tetratricopeptide repeat protein [Candidatus Sericytochromatia bacterium]|nr:tetratricopeptide repeat protein [Candidatus Sericytochromatia bacterium]